MASDSSDRCSSERTTIVNDNPSNLRSPASGATAVPKPTIDIGPYPVASVGVEIVFAPVVMVRSKAVPVRLFFLELNDDDSPSEANGRELIPHPIKNCFRRLATGTSTNQWQRDRIEFLLLSQCQCALT